MSLLRPPGRWPRAQQRFRERFRAQPAGLPSRPVHIRWFTSGQRPEVPTGPLANAPRWQDLSQIQILGLAALAILAALWLVAVEAVPLAARVGALVAALVPLALALRGPTVPGRHVPAGRRFVACYRPAAHLRTPPTLVFEVERSAFGGAPSGEGAAMLFGRASPNGTLCVVHEGIAVWPTGVPVRRMPQAPGR